MKLPINQRVTEQISETSPALPGIMWWSAGVGLLSAMLFAVCPVPVFPQEVVIKDLRVFYQQNCSRCHGQDGSGVTADGKKLDGQDFTDPEWRRETLDEEMAKTILNGKFFGMGMPGFKNKLTDEEIQRMVTDIIRVSKKGQVIAPDDKKPVGKYQPDGGV